MMRRGAVLFVLLALTLDGCGLRGRGRREEPLETATVPPPQPPSELACIQHPMIDAWERRLRSRPYRNDTRQTLRRGAAYLPRLRRILQESGVPPSLALLPAVESSFHPEARGKNDDRGLWQLRGATARRFGLVVTSERDDRLHPDHSTRAAARYLRLLHRRYRDWPTALAAYNAGERRIDRARARRPAASFWELASSGQLPSRDYVPRFLAVVRLSEGVQGCRRPEPVPPRQVEAPRPRSVRRSILAALAF